MDNLCEAVMKIFMADAHLIENSVDDVKGREIGERWGKADKQAVSQMSVKHWARARDRALGHIARSSIFSLLIHLHQRSDHDVDKPRCCLLKYIYLLAIYICFLEDGHLMSLA